MTSTASWRGPGASKHDRHGAMPSVREYTDVDGIRSEDEGVSLTIRNGEPRVITCRTDSGFKWARRRAKIPPIDHPMSETLLASPSVEVQVAPTDAVEHPLCRSLVPTESPAVHVIAESLQEATQRAGGHVVCTEARHHQDGVAITPR